jgi:hypothetical protein
MIRPGDRVRWDTQAGRTIEYDPDAWGHIVPAGTGIVLAVARGNIPKDTFIDTTPNSRSYIVRSDEDWPIDRKLLWLVDIHPELPDAAR